MHPHGALGAPPLLAVHSKGDLARARSLHRLRARPQPARGGRERPPAAAGSRAVNRNPERASDPPVCRRAAAAKGPPRRAFSPHQAHRHRPRARGPGPARHRHSPTSRAADHAGSCRAPGGKPAEAMAKSPWPAGVNLTKPAPGRSPAKSGSESPPVQLLRGRMEAACKAAPSRPWPCCGWPLGAPGSSGTRHGGASTAAAVRRRGRDGKKTAPHRAAACGSGNGRLWEQGARRHRRPSGGLTQIEPISGLMPGHGARILSRPRPAILAECPRQPLSAVDVDDMVAG